MAEPTKTLPSVKPSDVPATLYLNSRLVLDMLASVQDGFVQAVSVERVSSVGRAGESEASAGISGGSLLSFIGLNVGGKLRQSSEQGDSETHSGNRTHTLASLFSRLRSDLRNRSFVKDVESPQDLPGINPGDFVEATIRVQRNGLIEVIRGVKTFMELAESMPGTSGGQPPNSKQSSTPRSNSATRKQLDWILTKARPGKFEDLVGVTLSEKPVSVVMPVDGALFMDETMSEVLNCDVRVLGKVTRVLTKDSDAALNLMRGTDLGALGTALWDDVVSSVATADLRRHLTLPDEITVSVKSPALQLIPVALFV